MVQRIPPPPGRGDGYIYIILDFFLPDEVVKAPGPEAAVKGYILVVGLARNDAVYLKLPPAHPEKSKIFPGTRFII